MRYSIVGIGSLKSGAMMLLRRSPAVLWAEQANGREGMTYRITSYFEIQEGAARSAWAVVLTLAALACSEGAGKETQCPNRDADCSTQRFEELPAGLDGSSSTDFGPDLDIDRLELLDGGYDGEFGVDGGGDLAVDKADHHDNELMEVDVCAPQCQEH